MSYDPTLSTDRDKVRLYLGDTDVTSEQVKDTEIDAMLLVYADPMACAAAFADSLAARYARRVDTTVDGLSVSWSQRASAFRDLAERLRNQVAGGVGAIGLPLVTGVSIGEMDAVTSNPDRPRAAFPDNLNDNPAAGYPHDQLRWGE